MLRMLSELWARVRGTVGRRGLDAEMEEEFRFHLEQSTERNLRRGMSAEEARREAARRFGGEERFKEAARDEQRSRWLEGVLQDARYGARSLRRHPGFTVATVLTVALGIGANTAIFSVVDGVLLKPLPFAEPDRVVYLGWQYGSGQGINALSAYQFAHFRENTDVFEGVTTYRTFESELGAAERGATTRGMRVTEDFLRVVGVVPALGRGFDAAELVENGRDAAVLSDGLWRREFGADPAVLGREIRVGGRSHTIVGVLPPAFRFPGAPDNTELLLPLRLNPDPRDEGLNYTVMARLRRDVSRAAADEALVVASRRLHALVPTPTTEGGSRARVREHRHLHAADLEPVLWIMLGAVGFVLLIACANAANLLLARASARGREIAVRLSIGASRGRIIRQLVTESVLLSLVAGVVGLAIGYVGLRALLALVPGGVPRADEIGLDVRVLGFTFALAALTGLVFGIAGALPASRADVVGALRRTARGMASPGRRSRSVLVVAETALAVVLLAGAGLLLNSFARLRTVDPGFETEGLLTARVTRLPSDLEPERRRAWEIDVLDRVRALSGVSDATLASNFPLERGMNLPMGVEGQPESAQGSVEWRAVSPGYFTTLRVPLVRGRAFGAGDGTNAPRVAIVNESFARQHWPDGGALGQRVEIGRWNGRWISPEFEGAAEIVGVVADIREIGLGREPRATVYVPHAQAPAGMLGPPRLMLRTADAGTLGPQVTAAVRAADPRVPPPVLGTMEGILGDSLAEQRFQALLLGVFALSALLLTAVGLYGVVSFGVNQRSREIGIRMALGARSRSILARVVGEGMLMIGVGAAIGLVAAAWLTRFLSSALFGVSAHDPRTFAAAIAVLLLVGAGAAWLPARRAARVPPATVLQGD